MKDIIKKILKEAREVPDWFAEWENLPEELRIKEFEKRKRKYLKILPKMVEFFEEKFADSLDHIEIGEKKVHYGHESYSMSVPTLIFYFNQADVGVKWEIQGYIINLFGVEMGYYGIPFDFEVYVKNWQRI